MDIEKVQFSPNDVIRDLLIMMRYQTKEKNLQLVLSKNFPDDAMLIGDPTRLRQILINLLGNSIKFTHAGIIKLTINAQSVPFGTKAISEAESNGSAPSIGHVETHGDFHIVDYIFNVQDSGIGIHGKSLHTLFQPFTQAEFSTARTYGGSGLGLTICHQLIELLGGKISLQSTPGVGTVVTFNIPFLTRDPPPMRISAEALLHQESVALHTKESIVNWEAAIQSATIQPADILPAIILGHEYSTSVPSTPDLEPHESHLRPQGPSRNISSLSAEERARHHILVVEDSVINRRICEMSVRKLGFSVCAVCNGQEALDYLTDITNQRPDAILMDCQMPGMLIYLLLFHNWTLLMIRGDGWLPSYGQDSPRLKSF
jgi:hypothetical protein